MKTLRDYEENGNYTKFVEDEILYCHSETDQKEAKDDWLSSYEILYCHSETDQKDTKDGWLSSYSEEELEYRGLTAEEAFYEDLNVTLFEM